MWIAARSFCLKRNICSKFTPDKGSQDGCVMPGVYCLEKGQTIWRNDSKGLFRWWHRQAAGETRTKCCPHERGHCGHCTGWKWTSGTRRQTSYFFCTYRSFFQRGCGLFLFDTFLSYSRTYYKRIHDFHYGRACHCAGALFCALVYASYEARAPSLRS